VGPRREARRTVFPSYIYPAKVPAASTWIGKLVVYLAETASMRRRKLQRFRGQKIDRKDLIERASRWRSSNAVGENQAGRSLRSRAAREATTSDRTSWRAGTLQRLRAWQPPSIGKVWGTAVVVSAVR